eukprot:Phypoly_transcript_06792.p1 GENE.Phypoly_transcript_06792~~Phypoly_transcript_06792.p1  ORF type:complete len:557 (+),score=105.14 Phypoly_transcript_06792:27-1697(+)
MPPIRKRGMKQLTSGDVDNKKQKVDNDENNNNNKTKKQEKKDQIIWEWAGDSKAGGSQDIWVKYKADVAKKIEVAYQNKDAEFKLDDERFIDLKDMLQRRYDSKNKKRAIRRREIKVIDGEEEVDEKDLSMVFRIYDEQGRGKIDSEELNSIVRALGQEEMDVAEKPKGLVDFSTVKEIVKKRGQEGKLRAVENVSDGQVKKNLKYLQKKSENTPFTYPDTKPSKTTKGKKGKKAVYNPIYCGTQDLFKKPVFCINDDPEPEPKERNKVYTFYNKSAMLHTKDEIDARSVDKYDNVSGNEHDLGKDHMFSGYVVLIGVFYDEINSTHGAHGICSKTVEALMQKGFNVILAYQISTFLDLLQYADVAWVISGDKIIPENNTTVLAAHFREELERFHKRGGGICIWGDNAPYYAHANAFLELFDTTVTGCTNGQKNLTLGNGRNMGEFSRHFLTSGIATLYEGHTICYPTRSGPFQLLATSTDKYPVMMYLDHEPKGTLKKDVGRVVLDCAFTKLYINWDTAGTARWVSNISVWLLGLDTKLKNGVGLEGVLAKVKLA